MARQQSESVVPARVVGAILALAGLLWLAPYGLREVERASAAAHEARETQRLAGLGLANLTRSLEALERTLYAVQADPGPWAAPDSPPALAGLVRHARVLDAVEEDEQRLFGQQRPVNPGNIVLGAPQPGRDGQWVMPVLRTASAATEHPVLALIDPDRLLPEMPQGGAALLLADMDGLIHAGAGVAGGQIGRRLAGLSLPAPTQPGSWRGTSPLNGEDARLSAVPLPGTRLVLVATQQLALPVWAGPVWTLTLGGGLALTAAAGLLLWRQRRMQLSALIAGRAELALATAHLRVSSAEAARSAQRLDIVLAGIEDGACLLNDQLRVVAWNERFPPLAGLAPDLLRVGLPIGEVLRQQDAAATGDDAGRATLRQRLAELQARRSGSAIRRHSDGTRIEERWTTLLDDSILLTCRHVSAATTSAAPASLDGRGLAAMCAAELRKREPLLLAAATSGDPGATRMEAHAMRGVAANFGLVPVADALRAVEAAARANDVPAMRAAALALPAVLETSVAGMLARVA